MIDITRFLEDRTGRYAKPYAEAVTDMLVALLQDKTQAFKDATARLDKVIRETSGIAAVIGASTALRAAAGAMGESFAAMRLGRGAVASLDAGLSLSFLRREHYALAMFKDQDTQTLLPRITFVEALEDLVNRTPQTLKDAAERTATNIAKLYGEDSKGVGRIAFVRAAEESVTKKAQEIIGKAVADGVGANEAGRLLSGGIEDIRQLSGPWSESYSRMVFRTNVNTAVTAGRFAQVQDPDIAAVVPAFRFTTAGDTDVRSNHAPMNGVILKTGNTLWNTYASPLGYGCRCQMNFVTVPQLRRMGRLDKDGKVIESKIPAGAGPDDGFRHGGRPDLGLVA